MPSRRRSTPVSYQVLFGANSVPQKHDILTNRALSDIRCPHKLGVMTLLTMRVTLVPNLAASVWTASPAGEMTGFSEGASF